MSVHKQIGSHLLDFTKEQINMKNYILMSIAVFISLPSIGQENNTPIKSPIIDMHLHTAFRGAGRERKKPNLISYKDQATHRDSTFMFLKQYNIVKAVTDGPYALDYQERNPELFIPGITRAHSIPIDSLRKLFEEGTYNIMAEFGPQYSGLAPNDETLEPYFSLAEELDIPVGIHMGPGPPGAASFGMTNYRMSLSNPLLLEDVLVKHLKLRIYIMHAGYPFIDELIGLLWAYPQVYVDVAVINWVLPQFEFHNYLRRIVEAGYGDRIMYGSDEMQWPQSIKISVENIRAADFLSEKQKEDIFYNNAARFLRLSDEEIKKHKGFED